MEEGVELIKSDGIAQFKRKMPLFALSEEVDLEGMKMWISACHLDAKLFDFPSHYVFNM